MSEKIKPSTAIDSLNHNQLKYNPGCLFGSPDYIFRHTNSPGIRTEIKFELV